MVKFRTMSNGVPATVSDFPLWRKIVTTTNCGILVDPLEPKAIAEAMQTLCMDKAIGADFGMNGLTGVAETYNWNEQKSVLLSMYASIGMRT